MTNSLSSALHPLGFDMGARLGGAQARHAQIQQWHRVLGGSAEAPPARLMAEHPLVASARLQAELDKHVAQLTDFLVPRFAAALESPALSAWPNLRAPDVVCADLAIVEDPSSPEGWSLRWVEFQAFASIVASIYTRHLAGADLWPESRGLEAWRLPNGESDWLACARRWVAPAGGILLERAQHQQLSRFDLQAAAKLFNLDMVDPVQLRRSGSQLQFQGPTGLQDVNHVFNRLVMHELDEHGQPNSRAQFEQLAAGAAASWHSHPAWYYGLSKAWLPDLPQASALRCATATTWRELGLPAEALVAKNSHSHGGAAVHLHVTAEQLDTLPDLANWIVQPRYSAQALFSATDGAKVFGELRCVLALPAGEEPWVAAQMLRLSRGAKVSASNQAEEPGTGFALLYRPPED